jgi:hypothetical protein
MANHCDNILTVTGGTKENLQELSNKFLNPPDEDGFEAIFNINSFELIDHSGGFFLDFTTNWVPPSDFIVQLSAIYQVNVVLKFYEPMMDFGGMIKVSCGLITDDVLMPHNQWVYVDDRERFMEFEGIALVENAIDEDVDIEDFKKSLFYLSDEDKDQLLFLFLDIKLNPIES